MTAIHLRVFGGLNTVKAPRTLQPHEAQVAHNCLLWDGALRPLAKWVNLNIGQTGKHSIDVSEDGSTYLLSEMSRVVALDSMTHPKDSVIGLAPLQLQGGQSNIGYQNSLSPTVYEVGVLPPEVSLSSSVVYTRQHLSNKPVNRLYGVTSVRKTGDYIEESSISVIPNQDPTAVLYEGDLAQVNVIIIGGGIFERTSHRLYRTTSELDTGHAAGNAFKTEWHLVAELAHSYDVPGQTRSYQYNDGGAIAALPMDLLLSTRFYPPRATSWQYLALTEGGWLVAAQRAGELAISERSLYHAWPTENYRNIPTQITGLAAHYDTVYIGTLEQPYMMPVSATDVSATQATPKPYPVRYACLPNSMAETVFGAMYASASGLVSLSSEGAKLITAPHASALYPLYQAQYKSSTDQSIHVLELQFAQTTYAAYLNGQYFGFCDLGRVDGQTSHLGYLYTQADGIDADHPLQRLVTFDAPNGTVLDHCAAAAGITVLTNRATPDGGDPNTLYNAAWMMPFPDSTQATTYRSAAKMCYQWRSKVFAFEEFLNMACARVVFEGGFVRLRIYVDGCCTYETKVRDCLPFTLPPNMVGHTYEIGLEGTATVHEVHLATAIEDIPLGPQANP